VPAGLLYSGTKYPAQAWCIASCKFNTMKKSLLSIATILCLSGFAHSAVPQTITQWTFEGDVTTPSTGSGTVQLIGGTSATFAAGNGGGRGWNTSSYQSQGEGSGTAGIQININTTGFEDITLDFDHRASGTASRWSQIDYSLDGGDNWVVGFWSNGGGISPHDVFYSFNVDFSSISGVNDNSQFQIRIVSIFSPDAFGQNATLNYGANEAYQRANAQSGAVDEGTGTGDYGSGGTWRFDNITFSGIALPPPVGQANVIWALGGGGAWNETAENWTNGDPAPNQFKTGDNVTFNNNAGGTISVDAGGIEVANILVSADAGTYTFAGGSINGSGQLTKSGDGILILDFANGYTGGTNVLGGELQFSNDNQLGQSGGILTINGGQVTTLDSIASSRTLSVGSNHATIDTNGFDSSFGNLSGTGDFTKQGVGDLSVSGWNLAGAFNVLEGNLRLQAPGALSLGMGGTLDGDLFVDSVSRLNFGEGSISGDGSIKVTQSLSSIANTGSGLNSVLNVNIELNANGSLDDFSTNIGTTSGNTMTINGVISGDSDVRFSAGSSGGAGILLLNEQNTYTGNSQINNAQTGVIRLGVENALPTTTGVTWGITQNSGSIDLNGFNQTLAYVANANADQYLTGGIANTGAASTLTLNQDIDTVFRSSIGTVSHLTNLPGANNEIRLIKNGSGVLTLTSDNTYANGTEINAGGIVAAATNALGSGSVTINAGQLTVVGGAVLNLDQSSTLTMASDAAVFRKEFFYDADFNFGEQLDSFGIVTGAFAGKSATSVGILAGTAGSIGAFAELTFTDVNPALGGLAPEGLIANLTGLNGQVFAMQLTLDVPVSEGWMLGWFDPFAGQWTNAVDGNVLDPDFEYLYAGYAGNVAFNDFLADIGEGFGDSYLGAWGIDSSNNAVWAVLNHNSNFAVLNAIPEPSTAMLFGLGAGLWALRRRRR